MSRYDGDEIGYTENGKEIGKKKINQSIRTKSRNPKLPSVEKIILAGVVKPHTKPNNRLLWETKY